MVSYNTELSSCEVLTRLGYGQRTANKVSGFLIWYQKLAYRVVIRTTGNQNSARPGCPRWVSDHIIKGGWRA